MLRLLVENNRLTAVLMDYLSAAASPVKYKVYHFIDCSSPEKMKSFKPLY